MNDPFRYRPSSRMAALSAEVVSAISADACLDAAFRGGKMLGILIHDRGWEVAYSGKRMASVPGLSVGEGEGRMFKEFVPPVYDVSVGPFREKEEEISALNRAVAEALAGGREDEAAGLKLQRAMESVKLQKWTFSQYVVHNALGESRSVLDIFAERGVLPPASAGDCAAPKLLEYAYLHGLEPIEIGEFWYGASPFGPVRAQGRFYPSCSWKCGPVLGYMMEGLASDPSPAVSMGAANPGILFEDDDIIVVDKPSGMPAVSGLDGRLSLEEWLSSRQSRSSGPAPHDRAEVSGIFQVHRLDQDTSGVIVFARNRQTQAALRRQFEDRTVEKTYVAVLDMSKSSGPAVTAVGQAADGTADIFIESGTIDLPLAPDFEDKPRQKVDRVQGKKAVTDYRLLSGPEAEAVLAFFHLSAVSDAKNFKAVVFHPRTGRSHQLRVHASHVQGLGSPILGDTLYGGAMEFPGQDPAGRLCLHASSITFRHPSNGQTLTFSSGPLK